MRYVLFSGQSSCTVTVFFPQKMKVVPVDRKSYGNFHTGDSYIVLQVKFELPQLAISIVVKPR